MQDRVNVQQSQVMVESAREACEEAMRGRQRQAQYPELLAAANSTAAQQRNALYAVQRPGSGLRVVALLHDALTPVQRQQLSEFRLHQYALWGWYDMAIVADRHFEHDPAFDSLPGGTIHVVVGGPDDRLLTYECMQPAAHVAVPSGELTDELLNPPGRPRRDTSLRDAWRPLFCMEVESFGPDLLTSLPALAQLPLGSMREFTCLIRNATITSPLIAMAAVESLYAMAHVVMQPDSGIQAVVGCSDLEARRVSHVLGFPFLYAPLAPVVRNQFEYYWVPTINVPGRFWPFVVATDDLHANADHFRSLDTMLNGSLRDIRRGVVERRREPKAVAPRALVRTDGESSHLWTADPFFAPSAEMIEALYARSVVKWPSGEKA